MTPLTVTAELAGPVADYLPMLDSLLVEIASHREGRPAPRGPRREARSRPLRCNPAPAPMDVPEGVPLAREAIGGWPVYRCSNPIAAASPPNVSHFGKRIGVEKALLLAPEERKTVVTTNTWTKSYRLPVNVLAPQRIVWFVVGDAVGLRDMLADVPFVGRVVRHGWGRVREWRVEPFESDWSWYAPDESGRPVLMRPMPLCPEIPEALDGWRPDFGAVCPPYWHADRYTEVVVPC